MQMIMASLAKEGFIPGQSIVDEVIRHLWWKREHSAGKLRLAEKAIKKMSGGDKLAFQVCTTYTYVQVWFWGGGRVTSLQKTNLFPEQF